MILKGITTEMMDPNRQSRGELEQLISQLEKQLEDLQARLPAHSITPNLIEQLDEIDRQLSEAKSALVEMEAHTNNS